MIRLLTLVPKRKGLSPGQRFRLEQWAPHLFEKHGIELDFLPYESAELTAIIHQRGAVAMKALRMLADTWRRREVLTLAPRYDGVVVFRELSLLGPAIYERLLARAGVPLFLDFDDAIWLDGQGVGVNGAFSRLKFSAEKTVTMCRLSRAITVGNSHLARFAHGYNRSVYVVPTSIELSDYQVRPPLAQSDPFVIGWTGSFSTLVHLEHAREAIETLARKRRVVVRVMCNKPPDRPFAGAENVFVPWREDAEVEELGRAHVGLMPLPDDEYARGKCGLKALQYMSVGRPVVVSPVGVNSEIVKTGENGFVADAPRDWVARLEALAESPELRERLGRAARRTVEERYSAAICAAHFARAIRAGLGREAEPVRSALHTN
jgi:glycosyltransferase involved in cell wall biosynthesis